MSERCMRAIRRRQVLMVLIRVSRDSVVPEDLLMVRIAVDYRQKPAMLLPGRLQLL